MSAFKATSCTGVTEASIALLIDHFYAAIRRDPVLAKVFEAAIAGPPIWTTPYFRLRTWARTRASHSGSADSGREAVVISGVMAGRG